MLRGKLVPWNLSFNALTSRRVSQPNPPHINNEFCRDRKSNWCKIHCGLYRVACFRRHEIEAFVRCQHNAEQCMNAHYSSYLYMEKYLFVKKI